MSRDHYKGVPKKRPAIIGANGDIEVPAVGGYVAEYKGTVDLVSNTATVSGAHITADSFAIITGKHGGPTDPNWACYDGYCTISGTGDGTVAFQIIVK